MCASRAKPNGIRSRLIDKLHAVVEVKIRVEIHSVRIEKEPSRTETKRPSR